MEREGEREWTLFLMGVIACLSLYIEIELYIVMPKFSKLLGLNAVDC